MPTLRNTTQQYGWLARCLHWLSVALGFAAIVIAVNADSNREAPGRTSDLALHASLGLTMLVVMLMRLYWRTVNINPVESYALPRWYKVLGMSLHRAIYCLIIALALTGALQVAFRGESLGVSGYLGAANLVSENDRLGSLWQDVHSRFTYVFYVVIAVHVLGAIVHQVFGVAPEVDE